MSAWEKKFPTFTLNDEGERVATPGPGSVRATPNKELRSIRAPSPLNASTGSGAGFNSTYPLRKAKVPAKALTPEEALNAAMQTQQAVIDYSSTSIQAGGDRSIGRSPSPILARPASPSQEEQRRVAFGLRSHHGASGFDCVEAAIARSHLRLKDRPLQERWEIMANWLDKCFEDIDARNLARNTRAVWVQVKNATKGRPNPCALRTASSFMLMEQVLHMLSLAYPDLYDVARDLRDDLLASIYVAPPTNSSKGFEFMTDATDVELQERLISRFYGKTYFHAVREIVRKLDSSHVRYESAERVKGKQMNVLDRVVEFWQTYVKRRLFYAWREEARRTHRSKLNDDILQKVHAEREKLQVETLKKHEKIEAQEKLIATLRGDMATLQQQLHMEREYTKRREADLHEAEQELALFRSLTNVSHSSELESPAATRRELEEEVKALKRTVMELSSHLGEMQRSVEVSDTERSVLKSLMYDTVQRVGAPDDTVLKKLKPPMEPAAYNAILAGQLYDTLDPVGSDGKRVSASTTPSTTPQAGYLGADGGTRTMPDPKPFLRYLMLPHDDGDVAALKQPFLEWVEAMQNVAHVARPPDAEVDPNSKSLSVLLTELYTNRRLVEPATKISLHNSRRRRSSISDLPKSTDEWRAMVGTAFERRSSLDRALFTLLVGGDMGTARAPATKPPTPADHGNGFKLRADIDWLALREKLPIEKTPEEKAHRMKMFSAFDPNGNGRLSFAEVQDGFRDVVGLDDIAQNSKPIVMRAFQAAKGAKKSSNGSQDEFVQRGEFRLLLWYLKQYLEIRHVFAAVDTSGDHRVDFAEFQRAVPTMIGWGVDIQDPKAEFDGIDANNGGKVLFDEFASWALNKGLEFVEDDEVSEDAPTPTPTPTPTPVAAPPPPPPAVEEEEVDEREEEINERMANSGW